MTSCDDPLGRVRVSARARLCAALLPDDVGVLEDDAVEDGEGGPGLGADLGDAALDADGVAFFAAVVVAHDGDDPVAAADDLGLLDEEPQGGAAAGGGCDFFDGAFPSWGGDPLADDGVGRGVGAAWGLGAADGGDDAQRGVFDVLGVGRGPADGGAGRRLRLFAGYFVDDTRGQDTDD